MNIYYDKDCDLSIIQGKKVTIVGYGSQGHAHANNLKDSGVDVTVALRQGSASAAKAEAAGLVVKNTTEAIKSAEFVMILTPDEFQHQLYQDEIEPHIRQALTDGTQAKLHKSRNHVFRFKKRLHRPLTNSEKPTRIHPSVKQRYLSDDKYRPPRLKALVETIGWDAIDVGV